MSPIIGLCRFSFLGKGDWRAWRGPQPAPDDQRREELAAALYTPARMNERFWTFENLLMRSLLAQTNPDFHLVVLTSQSLPDQYQARLKALVARVPQGHLEISQAETVNDGLFPVINRLRGAASDSIQFRIDDDDCLASDYIARLADFGRRMKGYGAFSYSRPVGLMVSSYAGQGIGYFTQEQPFHSVGTALRVTNPQKTVFSFGHFALQRRFPSFLDWKAPGFLAIKRDGHDSLPMLADRLPRGFTKLTPEDFAASAQSAFPFLRPKDMEAWLSEGNP